MLKVPVRMRGAASFCLAHILMAIGTKVALLQIPTRSQGIAIYLQIDCFPTSWHIWYLTGRRMNVQPLRSASLNGSFPESAAESWGASVRRGPRSGCAGPRSALQRPSATRTAPTTFKNPQNCRKEGRCDTCAAPLDSGSTSEEGAPSASATYQDQVDAAAAAAPVQDGSAARLRPGD